MFEHIGGEFLGGVTSDFTNEDGIDIIKRWDRYHAWLGGRLSHNIDPYSKFTSGSIATECSSGTRDGRSSNGVNFGSQEYLNLASHPKVHEAAKRAIDAYGVHSAGSAALMGNTKLSRELEDRLAGFLGYRDCTVFPTGWGAGYGAIKTLVRPDDHIVIDVFAHACLQEAAKNATSNIHPFPHLSNEGVRRRLQRIRRDNPNAGILVVTETLFSMDSDVPNISGLQAICREHNATLFVDVAHDLGAIGPTGRGFLEMQDMLGQPDILMGSFSKTFASNGGFVACNNPSLKLALRYNCGPLTFTNAMSPVQCAIVLKCIDIIESDEGAERRSLLMDNSTYMRSQLKEVGFKVLGQPSAVIPVILGGNGLSRLMTRYTFEAGGIMNLVEYPAVSKNTCRWRLQVMALHKREHVDHFIQLAVGARSKAEAHLATLDSSLSRNAQAA
ncbi:aminotransferase class I/II-fold pyridoxal phosphate-dependent enzyme [Methylobacterium sp. WL12]|uniref:aminotransferase class I/II-fold pyridoxal phosphate-dependent enzyme n=1 Tax=Methylobacterium sp. WL12 TaxID=2603890 RepID=UPI0011C8F956|nr:aminotransferase class I/II-fold pyridoxal phosphate-dependent enzyme [Methylobacterium sp. WL12]TXM66467.1 aminotransferase class I/II-fold pyridoxal phosphate-dependent enzyme [Methylobacterium sp. WL12]